MAYEMFTGLSQLAREFMHIVYTFLSKVGNKRYF